MCADQVGEPMSPCLLREEHHTLGHQDASGQAVAGERVGAGEAGEGCLQFLWGHKAALLATHAINSLPPLASSRISDPLRLRAPTRACSVNTGSTGKRRRATAVPRHTKGG